MTRVAIHRPVDSAMWYVRYYAAGLRTSEVVQLTLPAIDSQ